MRPVASSGSASPGTGGKVLIERTTEGLDRIRAYYAGLAACTFDELTGLTDTELAFVLCFSHLARDNTAAEPTRLRATSPGPGRRRARRKGPRPQEQHSDLRRDHHPF
ncbi:hypothetical protein ACWDKQ_30200 [Saccharopolyspora sp. NPDC000995]